jgi:hypothetical protein
MMKIALLLAALLPLASFAQEAGPWQVKARQVSPASGFWPSFWRWAQNAPNTTGDLTVKVMDASGKPIKSATVLAGQSKGNPFPGNQITTDESGIASFRDDAISATPLTVTVAREGYSTVSVAKNTLNTVEITLARIPGERDFGFLAGKVTGFPPGYGRGTLELGILLPAFRPESLLNFDPQQFISSYKVEIDVFGKREVPGNLVLPSQNKWYGIVPISLSKPEFVMPLALGTRAHMSAVVGAVPIGGAVDAINNKDFLGVLNLATFSHAGFTTRRVEVNGDEKFDVDAGQEITPRAAAAKLNSLPPKIDAVALSLFDASGNEGDFIALDVKSLKSEEIKNGAGKIKLGLLKNRRDRDNFYLFTGIFDRNKIADKNATSRSIVGALQKLKITGEEPTAQFNSFLRPISSKGVGKSQRQYRFSSAANGNLRADFLLLNIVSEKNNSLTQGKTRTLLWSVVLPGNAEELALPDLGRPVLPPADASREEKFSWEVIAVKATEAAQAEELDVQSALRGLQHVSTLSQKF